MVRLKIIKFLQIIRSIIHLLVTFNIWQIFFLDSGQETSQEDPSISKKSWSSNESSGYEPSKTTAYEEDCAPITNALASGFDEKPHVISQLKSDSLPSTIIDVEPLQDLDNKEQYSKPSSPSTSDNRDCLIDNINDIVALEPLQEIENKEHFSKGSPPSIRQNKSCLNGNPDDTEIEREKSSTSLSTLAFNHGDSIPVQYFDDNKKDTFANVKQYESFLLKESNDQYNICSDFELHFEFSDEKLKVEKTDKSDSNSNNLNKNLLCGIEPSTCLATVTVDNISNELLVFYNDNVLEDNRNEHIPCDSNVNFKDTINTVDVSKKTSIDSNETKETINEKKSLGKFTSRLQKLSLLTPDFTTTSNVSKPSVNPDSSNPISSRTPPINGGKSFGKSFVTLKSIGNKWKQQIVAGNTNDLGSSLDTKTIDGINQAKQQSGF